MCLEQPTYPFLCVCAVVLLHHSYSSTAHNSTLIVSHLCIEINEMDRIGGTVGNRLAVHREDNPVSASIAPSCQSGILNRRLFTCCVRSSLLSGATCSPESATSVKLFDSDLTLPSIPGRTLTPRWGVKNIHAILPALAYSVRICSSPFAKVAGYWRIPTNRVLRGRGP